MCEKIEVDKDLVTLANIFKNAGFSLYLVGGALRDKYLKRTNYDIDVATDARPEEVSLLFKKIIPTGIKHGTVTIRFRGKNIECTTLRREEGYTDARHPDKVVYGSSIIEDLSRRDFTMNALAASLPDGFLFDPYGGKAEIENETLKAISLSLEKIAKVSIERIQEEFNKILKAKYTSNSLRLLRTTKVFSVFLPEVSNIKKEDFDILISQISYVPKEQLELRLTILFSYIYEVENSVKKIIRILKRLKYSNKIVEKVSNIIEVYNFDETSLNTQARIRHFIKDVGKEYINDILILKRAVIASSSTPSFDKIERIEKEIETILKEKQALSLKELAIKGDDLLACGFEADASLGVILERLLDVVLEDPKKNKKDELLKIANEFKK